jgi:hypothetical protein
MITKAERKSCWEDSIAEAVYEANEADKLNPSDEGTCNFDCAMVKKEKWFTYDETIEMFKKFGCFAYKASGRGWLLVGKSIGQADRNTRWNKKFAAVLAENGFTTSMYYQMD